MESCCSQKPEAVDFESVRRVIRDEGLDPRFVRIMYAGLTSDEIVKLKTIQEAQELPGGMVLARYPETGTPLFPEKATQIHTLEA